MKEIDVECVFTVDGFGNVLCVEYAFRVSGSEF